MLPMRDQSLRRSDRPQKIIVNVREIMCKTAPIRPLIVTAFLMKSDCLPL
jgi:hypothetical protein